MKLRDANLKAGDSFYIKAVVEGGGKTIAAVNQDDIRYTEIKWTSSTDECEIKDIVRAPKIVTIEYIELRSEDICQAGDMIDLDYSQLVLKSTDFLIEQSYSVKEVLAKNSFYKRVLRRIK
jgi:hypothetical protein